MDLKKIKKQIKRLLLKEVKKIFKTYHIAITKYELYSMEEIYIDEHETKSGKYYGSMSNLIYASKKNKVTRRNSAGEVYRDPAMIAFGKTSFVFQDNELMLISYQIDFN